MATYNGWTNHTTWYLMLHIFADINFESEVTAGELKEIATDIIFDNQIITGVAEGLVRDALNEANWYEMANSINEDNGFPVPIARTT